MNSIKLIFNFNYFSSYFKPSYIQISQILMYIFCISKYLVLIKICFKKYFIKNQFGEVLKIIINKKIQETFYH